MTIAIITGSAGLIGTEAARFLHDKGFDIVGIDNDMRREFFGDEASTLWSRTSLLHDLKRYRHIAADVRDRAAIERIFSLYKSNIKTVIHAAAQPSHDWAAEYPANNFEINTAATMNLLEAARRLAPQATLIFLSSNKVYGDRVNGLPLTEFKTRWDLANHDYAHGVDETMSIDGSMHSLYGASKAAADLLVQEYGRYYQMPTVCFRCSCLSGPGHAGAQMHGFLSYLMKCAISGNRYNVIGYQGKQVRDHLHSRDVVAAFWQFMQNPKDGEIYNLGGGRGNELSVLESIRMCQELSGNLMDLRHVDEVRRGDHKWWVTNNHKFQTHYPEWKVRIDLNSMLMEMHEALVVREGKAKRYA